MWFYFQMATVAMCLLVSLKPIFVVEVLRLSDISDGLIENI
jgi:hypothetical protein